MNTVTTSIDTAGRPVWTCTCGARAGKKDRSRFLRRHPGKCSDREGFTRQVAQGTRHLDDLERNGNPIDEYDAFYKTESKIGKRVGIT